MNGKTILESEIRLRTGASVVGVIHEGEFLPNPKTDFCFSSGNLVAVIGSPRERDAFLDMAKAELL